MKSRTNERSKNMMKWFKNVTTVEGLRKEYRRLLKLYHPDNENGSVEVTQEINAEYDRLFSSLLSKETSTDNQSHTYNTDDESRRLSMQDEAEQKEEVKKATILTYFYPEVTVERMSSYRKKQ